MISDRARFHAAAWWLLFSSCLIGATRVELTVVGPGGTTAHEWGRALSKVPFDKVRIVAGDSGSPVMELDGTPTNGTYRITGVIDGRNQLRLPKATFRVTDKAGLTEWIESLSKPRPREAGGAERMAFGMSAQQLVNVTDSLSVAVRDATKDQRARAVIQKINGMVGAPIVLDPQVRAAIPATAVVDEELSGLSAGTVLAAVLRPHGLVMVPQSRNGVERLLVQSVRDAKEHWPVGWPATDAPHEHLPKLHEFLEVEIDETPLSETVAALQSRLEVPVLYDQNGMARQRIDPAEVLVSFPSKRTFYSRILKNVLFQAKLKYELRLDEADQPFLWVTPSKAS